MGRFALMVFSLIGVIAFNILANTLPLNNQTTGEISNRLPVLFTPASYVFSIWIVIYALLVLWLVGVWKLRNQKDQAYNKRSIYFILSCYLNIFWLYLWHYELFVWSLAAMFGLLVTLILLYFTYPDNNNHYLSRLPVSIYLGWICVAILANISYIMTLYQWDGLGLSDPLWAVIMLTFGAAAALHMRYHYYDIWFVLVFIWAFIGIAAKNGFDELLVSTAALFLCAVMLAGIIFIKKKPSANS